MKHWFEKYARRLKYAALLAMLIIPFLLYIAAVRDLDPAVNILLVLMGFSMLTAMKVG